MNVRHILSLPRFLDFLLHHMFSGFRDLATCHMNIKQYTPDVEVIERSKHSKGFSLNKIYTSISKIIVCELKRTRLDRKGAWVDSTF